MVLLEERHLGAASCGEQLRRTCSSCSIAFLDFPAALLAFGWGRVCPAFAFAFTLTSFTLGDAALEIKPIAAIWHEMAKEVPLGFHGEAVFFRNLKEGLGFFRGGGGSSREEKDGYGREFHGSSSNQ